MSEILRVSHHINDFKKFKSSRAIAKNYPLPRKQLKKTIGEEITTSVPRKSTAIRDTPRQKMANGEYCLGKIIAPKSYKKVNIAF